MNISFYYNYVKRYQHDDSETLEDIVIFSVTDGFNTADGVLRVQVITNSAMCTVLKYNWKVLITYWLLMLD